jgi:hypothetical protein
VHHETGALLSVAVNYGIRLVCTNEHAA